MTSVWNREHRLPWPFVFAIIIISFDVVLFDFYWRTLKVSFESFVLSGAILVTLEIVIFMGLVFALRRRAEPMKQR